MAKASVYEIVTERIIKALEEGVVPWRKPWASMHSAMAPANFISRKPYRGINNLLLGLTPYACPYWVTYKQAQKLGGNVVKGEKGSLVVYWNVVKDEQDETKVKFMAPRYYRVFNLEQTEGIEWEMPKVDAPAGESYDLHQDPVTLSYQDRPVIEHGGDRAFYRPSSDSIRMPEPEAFETAGHYRATLYHEMIHSTGNHARLDRGVDGYAAFGSPVYAKEELVAEIGAAFLCNIVGLDQSDLFDNTACYVKGWLKVLKDDPKMVMQAASAAQRAVDYIHPADGSDHE